MRRIFCVIAVLSLMCDLSAAPAGSVRLAKQSGRSVLVGNNMEVLAVFDGEVNSLSELPSHIRSFISLYDLVGDDAESFVSMKNASDDESVLPLLGDIEFDQGTPYNNLCPVLNGGRAVTGCVATAMAQVMRYWKYPAVGEGTAVYTSSNGAATYDFAAHPFDWDNILNTYTISTFGGVTNYNTAQASAVAELMLACGASVNMDYDAAGSGSYISNAYTAMRDKFKYSPDIRYLETNDPDWDDWAEALSEQFHKGLPVLYGGVSTSGGHAFVLDGYYIDTLTSGNTRTLFHVNWGWNGSQNGYFLLPKLQPDGNDNYSNLNQRMVLNIYPKNHVAVENVEKPEWNGIDYSKPVYNILGVALPAGQMQRGMIYIQDGHKFVY